MRIIHCLSLAFTTIALAVQGSSTVQAALINIANGAAAIGGSRSLEAGFLSGGNQSTAFKASNVTDGQNATPDNNTGTITENFGEGSYWLSDGKPVNGPLPTSYFVLDLGTAYPIDQIVLFNTSNGTPQERGTGDFTVKASNSVVDLGDNGFNPSGFDLSGTIVTLVSNTLAAEDNPLNSVTAQSFASANNVTAFRYIRFDALTVAALGGLNGAGLNEIRIFAAEVLAPEPTSASLLMLGFCGIAAARRAAKRRIHA